MSQEEYEAAIAAFIRSNRITRCPTACVVPTQGLIAAADRIALQNHAMARSRAQQRRIAARGQSFTGRRVPVGPSE